MGRNRSQQQGCQIFTGCLNVVGVVPTSLEQNKTPRHCQSQLSTDDVWPPASSNSCCRQELKQHCRHGNHGGDVTSRQDGRRRCRNRPTSIRQRTARLVEERGGVYILINYEVSGAKQKPIKDDRRRKSDWQDSV